jgi:hypothetical protein
MITPLMVPHTGQKQTTEPHTKPIYDKPSANNWQSSVPTTPTGPVGPKDYLKDIPEVPEYTSPTYDASTDAGSKYLEDGALSSNQLNDMISSGSPLMESARNTGMSIANQRGALNSGQAGDIAMGTMIQQAQPFAINDAQTVARVDQGQQQHFNGLDAAARQMGLNSDFTRWNHALQVDLNERGYDEQDRQQISQIFGGMADSILNSAARIMTTPDQVWDQTKSDVLSGIFNDLKPFFGGLLNFELS